MKKFGYLNSLIVAISVVASTNTVAAQPVLVCGMLNQQLAACNSNLGTCNTNLSQCQIDLSTCEADKALLQTGLDDANATILNLQTTITALEGDITSSLNALTQCTADKTALEAQLGAQPDLSSKKIFTLKIKKLVKKIRGKASRGKSTGKEFKEVKKLISSNDATASELGISVE